MKIAKKVNTKIKYIAIHYIVDWICPNCNKNNESDFIEEEDLNTKSDPQERCLDCNKIITIKLDDIFNLDGD